MSPMEQLAKQEYERGYSDGKSDFFAAGVAEGEMRARQRMIANRVAANQHPFAASGKPIDHIAASGKPIAEQEKQEPVATDLMDMLRLIETIKYLRGIAERGLGREIREDETIEQFVLGYVKQLESTQPVKQEPEVCQFPRQSNNEGGWTIEAKFLNALVKDMADDEFAVGMEETEAVLLALERIYAAPVSAPKQDPVAHYKDAPHTIYLQTGCDDPEDCECSFNEWGDTTWCADQIHDTDIPYIRADYDLKEEK